MTHIFLVHPDAAIREALKHTLESVWPDIECAEASPDNIPENISNSAVILGLSCPATISADRFIAIGDTTTDTVQPVRLNTLVSLISSRLQGQYMPHMLLIGDATLDTRSREWQQGGKNIALTEKEVDTLVYLYRAENPATREDLLRDVWDYAPDADTHTIETHIYRLRQKIESDSGNPQYLLTDKQGYYLAARSKA